MESSKRRQRPRSSQEARRNRRVVRRFRQDVAPPSKKARDVWPAMVRGGDEGDTEAGDPDHAPDGRRDSYSLG